MRAFRGFLGESVLVDGIVYHIHGCGLRGNQLVFYGYNRNLERELRMSMKQVMSGLVAAPREAAVME